MFFFYRIYSIKYYTELCLINVTTIYDQDMCNIFKMIAILEMFFEIFHQFRDNIKKFDLKLAEKFGIKLIPWLNF